MRRIHNNNITCWLWLILAAGTVISGCMEDSGDSTDPRTEGLHHWASFTLGEARGGFYGEQAKARTVYQPVRIVFDDVIPGDPVHDEFSMIFLRESDNLVVGAPCSPVLEYNDASDVFEGFLAPPVEGDWTLELNWNGSVGLERTYLTLEVSPSVPYHRVLEQNAGFSRKIFAWLEPENPEIGLQDFQVQVWRPSAGLLEFEPDTTISLRLIVSQTSTSEPSSGNVNPEHTGDGIYAGEVNFNEPGGWGVTLLNPEFDPPDSLVTFFFSF